MNLFRNLENLKWRVQYGGWKTLILYPDETLVTGIFGDADHESAIVF